VLLSVVIILLIALIRACEGGSSLDVKAYVDKVRPLIQSSNEIGDSFKQIPPSLNTFTRDQLSQRLDDLARHATSLADRAETSFPNVPGFAVPAHGYLLTALKARAVGLAELKPAMLQANVIPEETQAFQTFRAAVTGLLLSDEAYQFFAERTKAELGKAKQKSEVPDSSYIRDTDLARAEGQDNFVRKLRESEKLKATENLALVSYKTVPEQLNRDGDTANLPPADVFELIVSVTNKGNVRAEQVQIQVKLTSSFNPEPQASSAIVDVLEPGDTKQEVVRGLRPDRGDATNLIEISVVRPADVDQTDNADSFKFTMRKS